MVAVMASMASIQHRRAQEYERRRALLPATLERLVAESASGPPSELPLINVPLSLDLAPAALGCRRC